MVTDDESCPGRQRIASPAASTEFKLQTCDDKHRLARFLLLFRAERDELAEAPFFVLNFLVRGLVEVALPLLDKGRYQLKGQLPPVGKQINDGAFDAMMEAIRHDETPNFYFMHPPSLPPPSNFGATGHYGAAR